MTHEEKYNDIQLSLKSFAAQEELRLKFQSARVNYKEQESTILDCTNEIQY
jgi:hypothetical protein